MGVGGDKAAAGVREEYVAGSEKVRDEWGRGFFFKQKTAYEIKECDWSSDVCSSDLA